MFKKLMHRFTIIIAAICFILLSTSFYTNSGISKINTAASLKHSDSVRVVVIGDSIARGTGDEKGNGFPTYLPDFFKEASINKVKVDNLGVDGLRSSGLLERLKSEEYNSQIANSDLVVLSIGGNDILKLQYVSDITKYGIIYDSLKQIQDKYLVNLNEILKTIREINESASIAFIGLYNPREDMASYANTLLLNMWNHSTIEVLEKDGRAVFIPTQDIFKSDLKNYISSDSLHPNSAGYQAVSDKIAKILENMFSR